MSWLLIEVGQWSVSWSPETANRANALSKGAALNEPHASNTPPGSEEAVLAKFSCRVTGCRPVERASRHLPVVQ